MTRFRREDMHFDKWQERTYALNGKLSANSKFENAVASLKAGIRAGLDGAAADFATLTGARQYATLNA